jgi:nucleotide-binding universal stress UspA family protein
VIRRILVPTDFSEASELALRHASALARALGAELELLSSVFVSLLWGPESAVPMPADHLEQVRARVQQDLDARAQALAAAGLRARATVRFEPPVDVICEAAARWPADLIAMGTHGRSGIPAALLGSTTERCLRLAPCPVLTVRAGAAEPRALRRIAVATDFSAGARSALDWAGSLADAVDARIVLVHALEREADAPGARERLETLRAEFSDRLDRLHVEAGPADEVVLRGAEQHAADCLALGTRGLSGLDRLWLGSTAERVVRRAPLPAIVVKTP